MTAEKIVNLLKQENSLWVQSHNLEGVQPWVLVLPKNLLEVSDFLKKHPSIRMDYLRMITAIDFQKEFEIVYHLFSFDWEHSLVLKTRISKEVPSVPSVEKIWSAANWYEREAFDLMGIHFQDHSDLRRLLLPEGWEGHPLQKNYQEPPEVFGISTKRKNPR